jgi:hypothetical protein
MMKVTETDKEQNISDVKDDILSYVSNEIPNAAIDYHYGSIVFPWKDKYRARIIVEVEEA